jgi:rfaE bifunctional protein kinase chain/domain
MIRLKKAGEICSHFKDKTILVFGDIILDRYIFGEVQRISPEAPVPVVKIEREEGRLGGAGNVAANIRRLGAQYILSGLIGNDAYGEEIENMTDNSILQSSQNRTVTKTRVISNRQQLVRIDREEPLYISPQIEDQLIQSLEHKKIDAIIISDYAKGTLTQNIMEYLKLKAKMSQVPILVDPKPANFHLYKEIDAITPNIKEAEEFIENKINNEPDAEAALKKIMKQFKSNMAVITMGDRGISAGQKGRKSIHIPALTHEVYDVTGAGDTVIAVFTLAMVSGANLKDAINLANTAASIVVEKVGTAQASVDEICQRVKMIQKSR